MMTTPTCEYLHAHSPTMSESTFSPSSTTNVEANLLSTTRRAGLCFSMLMCPATRTPIESAATLKAPMPSKSPIVNTLVTSLGSTTSPRTV